jgi:16S rRNA (guanine966-N2)-methyltransferase
MRIIAGTARGATIAAPRGLATRPMTGRVRGAVFNILGEAVVDAAVLDLFAGSGSLGLEALSRGAATAVFVERRPAAAKVLLRNVEALGFADRTRVLVADALRLPASRLKGQFDVVFVDPPYGLAERRDQEGEIPGLLHNLFAGPMLKETVVVIVRTPRRPGRGRTGAGDLWLPEAAVAGDVRLYGADCVRFLRRSRQHGAIGGQPPAVSESKDPGSGLR